jgi:glycosyltransferase involved in cell wall biosynthesis
MKYIDHCVQSVLGQDYCDFDVWAYDNESTDGTYEYLLELEDKNEKLKVFQVPNIYPNGYGEAQEHVVENLESDYVTFVASDDFIEPDYISKCMSIIAKKPEKIKCIQSPIRGVSSDVRFSKEQTHVYKNLEDFKKQCLVRSPVNTPTVIWHKSILPFMRAHEAHDDAGVSCIGAGDYDTYCHLAHMGIFIYPIPAFMGYNYRWHEDQATWKVQKNNTNYDKIVQNYWRKKWDM